MNRPYRFGRFYSAFTLVGAVYSGWFAYQMLWYGYFWPALLGALAVPLSAFTAIGLWRKRRYGFFLLNFSILLGIVSNIFTWFQPSDLRLIYRVALGLLFCVAVAIIFAYFYKRRREFA